MQLAHVAATMGTCSRRQVGAVAVRDRRVLATGFNGSPAGTHHCNHENETYSSDHCGRCGRPLEYGYFHNRFMAADMDFHPFEAATDPDLITVNGRPSCANAVHAEANVIAYAASYGVVLRGASIYTNTYPCHGCAKQMVSCGIVEVVYDADYNNDPLVERLCGESGMRLRRYEAAR